jgi:hypothetical protein
MRFLVPLTAAMLLVGTSTTMAQPSTTTTSSSTTFSAEHGSVIRQDSTTQKYKSYSDPSFQARVGVELPSSAGLHPLPGTVNVPSAERYSYSIVNDRPVVVERSTRKVVHTWE